MFEEQRSSSSFYLAVAVCNKELPNENFFHLSRGWSESRTLENLLSTGRAVLWLLFLVFHVASTSLLSFSHLQEEAENSALNFLFERTLRHSTIICIIIFVLCLQFCQVLNVTPDYKIWVSALLFKKYDIWESFSQDQESPHPSSVGTEGPKRD